MQEQATARDVCFRAAIVQYFGEEHSQRRKTLAVRIVEWLFSRSNRIVRAHGCCDKCDQVRVDNVVLWAARLWGSAAAKAQYAPAR